LKLLKLVICKRQYYCGERDLRILNSENKIIDTDVLRTDLHFSVLSFKTYSEPDFYFERATAYEQIECASASLKIGEFSLVVPFPWCILVTDFDMIDCLPIDNLLGKSMPAFALNPIDGYRVEFLKVKLQMIYPSGSFIIPVLGNKDMLVVPLGPGRIRQDHKGNLVETGPLCVILSPTKMEISKSISDIF
jgi:hypothetical protein